MGCYRKAKQAIDALRGAFASKISTAENASCRWATAVKHPIQEPGVGFSGKLSGFSFSSSIVPKPNFPISNGRRFYYVDRYRVQHFKPRGLRRWFQNARVVIIVVLVGSGLLITVYYGNLDTVPYTKRKHLVLLSRELEKRMGETQFEQLKKSLQGNILPSLHPDSIRVRLIAKDIIDALQRGIRHEQGWRDVEYSDMPTTFAHVPETAPGTLLGGNHMSEEGKLDVDWSRKEEILDDKWVHQSREKGKSQPTTQHLEGLNWEVIVVNEPLINAFCLPGGKIVVFKGLLDHFRTDNEIATVISHEVAHAIARHAAETMTKNLWFMVLQLVLLQFISMPDVVHAMSNLLLRLPFSRRMEMEADYIGLLLMASAGYDPRVAPKLYEKLGQLTGDSNLKNYLSTHPSGKKRAQLLAQAKVMEEALSIYRETMAGRGVIGFL